MHRLRNMNFDNLIEIILVKVKMTNGSQYLFIKYVIFIWCMLAVIKIKTLG